MEDDGVYCPELRKIQKSLEQCWLHIKSYCCVNIYEDNCCLAVVLEYHMIVSIWKPVVFCYSYKKYINKAERNQHSKVELIIISVDTYHITYTFQSGCTPSSFLNVKELLVRSRCSIRNLSDSNRIWTHNHLVLKWTLNYSAKLANYRFTLKWVCDMIRTYCQSTIHKSIHNTAQSFKGQFGEIFECSFTN